MRILPICSSSKGNSAFIGEKNCGIVIDIGCSYKAFVGGLEKAGSSIEAVKAVLITHEHIDHVRGLLQLTKRTDIPVYTSRLTLEYIINNGLAASGARLRTLDRLSEIPADINAKFFRTSHDSVESVGYTLDFGSRKIGFCTDLGIVTDEVKKSIIGCDAVVLESNYDISMLAANPRYPATLKKRISGNFGHLSNNMSGCFAAELIKSGATQILLAHLSQENNTPEKAYSSVCNCLSVEGIRNNMDCIISVAPVMNTDGKYIAL